MNRAFRILIGDCSSYFWLPDSKKEEPFLLNMRNNIERIRRTKF